MPLPSVLFVSSEVSPFAKTGGLGDVVGALPIALKERGHDVRVLLPRYSHLSTSGMIEHAQPVAVPMGAGERWCKVFETRLPGSDVPLYLLEHDALFARGYIYDPPSGQPADQLLRVALLSRGAFALARHLHWTPDVFHAHDWPSALVPIYLNTAEAHAFPESASVLTIHNLLHQGKMPATLLAEAQLPWSEFRADSLEDFGGLNLLKGGLYHATMLTTVSPTYAREIRTAEYGCGLQHVLDLRGADLVGVLNGIDDRAWDPRTDPHLPAHFDAHELSGKAKCKRALQEELRLPARDDVCVLAMVARLSRQKGSDVVVEAAERLLSLGCQLVVLGAGDADLEHALLDMNVRLGDRLRARIGFDDGLAHRIYAGADLFLMPSRFEPCGLSQMYSQRYGTMPVVRSTGGLVDTVENFDADSGAGSGFRLEHLSADSLVDTVAWAVEAWRKAGAYTQMQRRAMQKKLGWGEAAAQYGDVYRWALERKRGF